MSDFPGKAYFQRLSSETDFNRDSLEKVYRLLHLLKVIQSAPDLKGKLALKGGTAIQFIYLGFQRLSVDIDLNYIENLDRDAMLKERKDIENMLFRIFREQGYSSGSPAQWHSEEQFLLTYRNAANNQDRLKVEINYSERLPVLPLKMQNLAHPFKILGEVKALSYQLEEHMAMKTRALLTRGTPRDLYDVFLLANGTLKFNLNLYRKLAIFYLCLASVDVRKLTTEMINRIDERDIRQNLLPLLRRRSHRLDMETLKEIPLKLIEKVLSFEPSEEQFLDEFYDKCTFNSRLLFGNMPVAKEIERHPVVLWRLKNCRK